MCRRQAEKFTGIIVNRIVGGKIVEEWSEGTYAYELAQQRLNHELRERERVEQELLVARRIQQASLPREVPTLEGWQINPYCQPAREVGGDFYDFHLLSEGRVGLVVGDATGKGVPAALVMTGVCAFLGGVATASGSSSPGEVLAQVNEALSARIPPNMFVTCFYAILDPESGHLSYANAGHTLRAVSATTRTKPTNWWRGDAPRTHDRHDLRGEGDDPCAGRRCLLLHRRVGRGT